MNLRHSVMRRNKIGIIVGLILLLSISNVVATVTVYSGNIETTCCYHSGDPSYCTGWEHNTYSTPIISGNFYYSYHLSYIFHGSTCNYCNGRQALVRPQGKIFTASGGIDESGSISGFGSDNDESYYGRITYHYTGSYTETCDATGHVTFVISTEPPNTVSGTTTCIDNTVLYIKDGSNYLECNNTSSSSYSFKIYNGASYRLSFDGANYEFECNGTNFEYNYDGCGHCTININDNCANLLTNQVTLIDNNDNIVYSGHGNPINLLSSEINENDELTVIWTTWHGLISKICYAQFDHDINLFDPFVYWNMNIRVYDNESNPIEGANVDFNQDCVINGYPTRNKYTDSSGLASFTQCENDNADLTVSKGGYKTLSVTVSGGWYDAYMSTYGLSVTLQSSDSEDDNVWDIINDSINDTDATEEPDDIPNNDTIPIDIHLYFRNTEGNIVTEINDTDDYVRCYYNVNTPDDVDMNLVFQRSFTGYYFYDVDTYLYSIDNNSYGYMNISNVNFSDSDYSYRAYIYDVSYPFDDRYTYLNVVNVTNNSETHYENLTGYCMFMNTNKNGSIDYREDITCYAMVISDNASLRTISLELYDNSTMLEYKNLTNSSYDNDNIYGWYLGYNYTLGHNYSLVLKGYDGSILDVDNVIAYNLVGNKLTIKVTDSFNHPLSNVYVFCEHYGSINTGWLSYGTFEGLPDGETRYKASKSGYRSGLWKTINLTSENEIVTYQLIQEKQVGSIQAVRMSDDDAKNLYYPLMYFLLTLMLLGALINVIKQ